MKNRFRFVTSALLLATALGASSALAATRTFNMVTVETDGVKMWQPSTIVVKKGDEVKIHAANKVPGAGQGHGLSIDAYKVKQVVTDKGTDIEFKADKAGIFQIYCQLHKTHIGAQLVVLE